MPYSIRYTLMGVVFGLCFPVIATLLDAWLTFQKISFQTLTQSQIQNPLLWMIDSAPLFLGLLACFVGVQYDRLRLSQLEKENLYDLLEEKNIALEDKVKERTLQLESNIEKLLVADKFRSEFIATVSHELRTPLTAISGAIKLLKSNAVGSVDQEAMTLVELADRNAVNLISLVNDILDIEKFERGKHQLELSVVCVSEIVEESFYLNQAYAASHDIRLSLEGADSGKKITVDVRRFLQILANLISNACKFSPKGSEVKITITERKKDVRISVVDQGEGISSALEKNIFEKFTQADSSSSRSQGGTGLGLNITKLLVESMGGAIGFHPAKEKGTVFYIDFFVKN